MNQDLYWLAINEPQWAMDDDNYKITKHNGKASYVHYVNLDHKELRAGRQSFSRSQWQAARDELLAPMIGVVERFLGSPFSTPEEDEAFDAIAKKQNGNDGSHHPEKSIAERYPHYYKSVRHLEHVDVYRVHQIFGIDDCSGCVQHASKKLLLSGARTGGKPKRKDIEEARDTLTRWLEIQE
jgi:hypothetical protein